MNFNIDLTLPKECNNSFSQFPPVLDSYLEERLQVLDFKPPWNDEEGAHVYLPYVIKNILIRFCGEYGKEAKSILDNLRIDIDAFIADNQLKKNGFSSDRFRDNIIVMVLAMWSLSRRNNKKKLEQEKNITKMKNKDDTIAFNEIYSATKKLLELIDSDVSKNVLGTATARERVISVIRSTSSSVTDQLIQSLRQFIDLLDAAGNNLHAAFSAELDWLDYEIKYAKPPSGRNDQYDVPILYGTIHWLISVFGISREKVCLLMAQCREHMEITKVRYLMDDKYEQKLVDDEDERYLEDDAAVLRSQYSRYRNKEKGKTLKRGVSNVYVTT